MEETAYPHLTVATVVEVQARFLLVEELADGLRVLNQPAGHVEPGEALAEAARRETLEETGWEIELSHLLGACRYTAANGVSYHRVAFAGRALEQRFATPPDQDILNCSWLTRAEMLEQSARMRSPLVLTTLQRYLEGCFYPLDFLF